MRLARVKDHGDPAYVAAVARAYFADDTRRAIQTLLGGRLGCRATIRRSATDA